MFKNFYTDCFLQSKYYAEIKSKYNVLFSFIGGSNLLECSSEDSDYDVTIVVSDNIEFSVVTDCYLRFKDRKLVHWYIVPINFLLNKQPTHRLNAILFFELFNLKDEFLLDLIDVNAYNNILGLKDELALIGIKYLVNKNSYYINNFETITVDYLNKPKFKVFYHLLYISYKFCSDFIDYLKIKQFKSAIKYKKLTKDLLDEVRPYIIKLRVFLDV